MPKSQLFESILDEVAQEYADAEIINRWMPEDGEYTGVITKYSEGDKVYDDGGKMAWARLTVQLIAPHDTGEGGIDGKEMSIGYSTKALFSLKGDTAALSGRVINDVRVALKVLQDSLGTVIGFEIKTTIAKNKQSYKNATITHIVPDAEAPETV